MELEQTKTKIYNLTGVKGVLIGWIVFVLITVVRSGLPYVSTEFLSLLLSISTLPAIAIVFIGIYRQRGVNSSFKKAANTLLPLIIVQAIEVAIVILYYYDIWLWAFDLADYLYQILLIICSYHFIQGCRMIAQNHHNNELVVRCKRAWYFAISALIISYLFIILGSLFLDTVEFGITTTMVMLRIPFVIIVIGLIPFMRTLYIVYRTYNIKSGPAV